MSDLANTLQRPATVAPVGAAAARALNAAGVSASREACCSTNAPVPAAHSSFREQSRISPFASRGIHLEKWPPTSIRHLAQGASRRAASVAAMISFS